MRRTSCAGCGGALTDFLDLGSSPLADRFPASSDDHETWYPLQLAVCADCWLVQLREVVDDKELFGSDYGFLTGASPSSVAYFRDWAAWALAEYPVEARKLTAEIACNDGTLLSHFAAAQCPVVGVEPAKPAALAAHAAGLPVVQRPFTSELAAEMRDQYGQAGLIVACNVAAHVADPLDFLHGIADFLDDDGVAVIEFQYLADLIAGCQFDHVYHEHRFYYSLTSFARLAARAGLLSETSMHVPAQGGSLRVVLRKHPSPAVWSLDERWLRGWRAYLSFADRVAYARQALLSALDAEIAAGRTLAGYGATAKSATLLNYCGISKQLAYIEDVTPSKIGRMTPGSRIPIIAPGLLSPPDTYLLLAWNYLAGILRREREFLDQGGHFIVPLPVAVRI